MSPWAVLFQSAGIISDILYTLKFDATFTGSPRELCFWGWELICFNSYITSSREKKGKFVKKGNPFTCPRAQPWPCWSKEFLPFPKSPKKSQESKKNMKNPDLSLIFSCSAFSFPDFSQETKSLTPRAPFWHLQAEFWAPEELGASCPPLARAVSSPRLCFAGSCASPRTAAALSREKLLLWALQRTPSTPALPLRWVIFLFFFPPFL